MNLNHDFKEFVGYFIAHDVRFMFDGCTGGRILHA